MLILISYIHVLLIYLLVIISQVIYSNCIKNVHFRQSVNTSSFSYRRYVYLSGGIENKFDRFVSVDCSTVNERCKVLAV